MILCFSPSPMSVGPSEKLRLHHNLVDTLLLFLSPRSVSIAWGREGWLSLSSHTEPMRWNQLVSKGTSWHFSSLTVLPGDSRSQQRASTLILQQQSSSQPFTPCPRCQGTQQGTEFVLSFRSNKFPTCTRRMSAAPQGKLKPYPCHLQ